MATHFKPIILFILIMSLMVKSNAQPINIAVTIVPPVSNDIVQILNDPNKVMVSITNTSNKDYSLKFHLTITGDNGVKLVTKEDYVPRRVFKLRALESVMVGLNEFTDYAIQSDIIYSGIDPAQVIRTRKVPEGNYSFCIEAFDYNTPGKTAPLSSGYPSGCAYNLNLVLLDPPQIVSVGNGDCGNKLTPRTPQLVNLIWLPPAGVSKFIQYKVEVVEVYPANREVNDAIFSYGAPLFIDETVTSNLFMISSIQQQLKLGAKYAFRVKALDPDSLTSFRNNGYSQVCWFTYGDEPNYNNANFSSQVLFPIEGDTLPFISPPIILKTTPVDINLKSLNNTISQLRNGISTNRIIKNYTFNPSFTEYARSKNNGINVSNSDLQKCILPTTISFNNQLAQVRGVQYDLQVNSEYEINNNPIKQTIISTSNYTYGMPTPQLISPENNAVLDEGNISFRFKTCDNCSNPFANQELNNLSTIKAIYDFDNLVKVNETLVLEIANNVNFSTIVANRIVRLNFETDVTQIGLVYDSVFKSFQINVPNLTNGIYFWRVKYLNNPDTSFQDFSAYRISAAYKINIGRYNSDNNSPCAASTCEGPSVAQNQRIAQSNLAVGASLKFGEFNMVVSSISASANSQFSGEGIILINPFPNGNNGASFYPIKVAFTNIQYNSLNQIYAGSAATINNNTNNIWNAITNVSSPQTANTNTISQICQTAQIVLPSNNANNQNGVNTPFIIPIIKHTFEYNFTVLGISFTPTSAKMNCALNMQGVKENKQYTFIGSALCLKASGWATESVEMNLLNDVSFNFFDSEILVESYKNDSANTRAVWDCSGFKHVHIEGNIKFSRNIIKPTNSSNPTYKVIGYYATNIISFNDIMYRIAINEPYQFGITGKQIEVNSPEIYIDRSGTTNPPNLIAPAQYNGTITNQWNGIFFPTLNITLKLFPGKNIQATNFFYDGEFTGRIASRNVISETSFLNSVKLSVDSLDINIVQDNFLNYHLTGLLDPGFDETLRLNYTMDVDVPDSTGEASVHGRVMMNEVLPLRFLKANFNVARTSSFTFDVTNDDYSMLLLLNGSLSIAADLDNIGQIDLPQLTVQGMKFHYSSDPNHKFFTGGTYSFASPQKTIGGYPININAIEEINLPQNRNFGINIVYGLSLGSQADAFSVTGNLALKAKTEITNNNIKFSFVGSSFDSLNISGKISVVDVLGKIYFYKNNPTYGNGLMGSVEADFEPGVKIVAQAYFGQFRNNQNVNNYWGIYGGAKFNEAIPVLGVMECNAFAGGVYYNMKLNENNTNVNIRRVLAPNLNNITVSLIPQANTTGFSAKIWLQSTGGGDSYKSLSTIGAVFNTNSWSLRELYLRGNMWLMPEDNKDVPVWADMNVNLDWTNHSLSGNFNAYIQSTGIQGIGNNYRAGYINLFISANKWYIRVGTPDDRIGVTVPELGAELNAYLCIGSIVPGVPELPDRIKNVLKNTQIGNFRDENIANGQGFAFGAYFSLNPGPKQFLIIKGELSLMLGFDISLIKYNETVSCDGVNNRSSLGFNNWYAQGQIYAYVYASLSIYIDVWFAEGSFNIFRGEAGVAMAGGLPNPTWATGAMAGRYRLLGGSIKGSFTYEFTVGDICRPTTIVDNPVAELKIIESINLANNSRNISPYASFSAALNFKPNETFSIELTDNNGVNYIRTFRAQVNPRLQNGNLITAITTQINSQAEGEDEYYVLDVNHATVLNGNTNYVLTFNSHFEERKNNTWAVARKNNGEEVRETKTINFTTGGFPNKLPQSIITTQLPTPNENYFKVIDKTNSSASLPKKFTLKFSQNISHIYFYDSANHVLPDIINGGTYNGKVAVNYILRIINYTNNSSNDYPLTVLSNQIICNLNLQNILSNNSIYKAQIIRKKILPVDVINQRLNANNNVNIRANNLSINDKYTIEKRNLTFNANTGNLVDDIADVEFIVYELYFKTSKFNSIYDKINQLQLTSNNRDNDYRVLKIRFSSQERFSNYELNNEIKVIDLYEREKQYFSKSDKQYEVYNILKQKANGTTYSSLLTSPEPFLITNSYYTQPNIEQYVAIESNVDFNNGTSLKNQLPEPTNNNIVFIAHHEQRVSIDRPKIQSYCAQYILLLANTIQSSNLYNQVNLSASERSSVQSIIRTSWTKRMGLDFDGTYVPDPNRYILRFILQRPNGSLGSIKNFFYQLN